MSGENSGPVLTFKGEPASYPYQIPKNTSDPRYDECSDHHQACDCREAELSEIISEMREGMLILRILKGWQDATMRLHSADDEGYGHCCYECMKPWPCATYELAEKHYLDSREIMRART